MIRLNFKLRAVLAGVIALTGLTISTMPAQQVETPQVNYQQMAPVPAWNPMLDEQNSLPDSLKNLTATSVSTPYATVTAPNFGGFRSSPYFPAHKAGDTSRELSAVNADFNNDGCQDIVSFQYSSLTLLAGNCKGSFKTIGTQTTAYNVFHPFAVDLNHDGYPDLVAITQPATYQGTVIAMINQKNGSFSDPVTISKKASVYSGLQTIALYDVNADGNMDVVIGGLGTVDTMTNSNLVFETIFGNSDGTFKPQVETASFIDYKPTFGFDGSSVVRLVNGKLYLYSVLIQSHRVNGTNFGAELIYRWALTSDGKVDTANPVAFQVPLSNSPNKYLQFVDLNGDGIEDMTLLNGDGMLYCALGQPDGTFLAVNYALPVYAGNNASVVQFRDVNNDGKLDAIIAGGAFAGMWPGNGDGTFRAPSETYIGGYSTNAYSGLSFPVSNHIIYDFDGDGVADIAFFDTIKRGFSFFKGKSGGTFVGAPCLASTSGDFPSNGLRIISTPDLNGDGYKDIIVSTSYGYLSGLNDGKGNFTYNILSPLIPITSMSAASFDFNKDGKEDVVFVNSDSAGYIHAYVGLSNGDGTITAVAQKLPFTATSTPGIAVGDINGDGYPDAIFAINNYVTPSYGVWAMLNDGKGNLTSGTYLSAGKTVYSFALADVNKDGKADLVLSSGAYAATPTSVYLSNGNGFSSTALNVQSTLPVNLTLAKDLTGDGIPDLVLGISNGTSQGLMFFMGKGDGSFSAGQSIITGLVPTFVGADDLNGDSLPDLFMSNSETVLNDVNDSTFGALVFLNSGSGTFATPLRYIGYGASTYMAAADFARTGSANLYMATGAGTTVFVNNGASSVRLNLAASSAQNTDSVSASVKVSAYYDDQPAPGGYVTLLADGKVIGRTSVASNGIASFTVSGLSVGSHSLSTLYEGDANYNQNAAGNTASLTVIKATPAFLLVSASPSLALQQGGSASATVRLTANAAFSGPVALTCSGVPQGTTCAFDQSSLTLAPGQSSTATVSVTATTSASLEQPSLLTKGEVRLAACGLFLLLPLVRRRRLMTSLVLLVLGLSVVSGLTGCSSSSPKQNVAAGTYTVSVVATPVDTTIAAQTVTLSVVVTSK